MIRSNRCNFNCTVTYILAQQSPIINDNTSTISYTFDNFFFINSQLIFVL